MVNYSCEVCGASFLTTYMIGRHMEQSHQLKKTNISVDKSDANNWIYKSCAKKSYSNVPYLDFNIVSPLQKLNDTMNGNKGKADVVAMIDEVVQRQVNSESLNGEILEKLTELSLRMERVIHQVDQLYSATANMPGPSSENQTGHQAVEKRSRAPKRPKKAPEPVQELDSDEEQSTCFGGTRSYIRRIMQMKINTKILECTIILAFAEFTKQKINKNELSELVAEIESATAHESLYKATMLFNTPIKVYHSSLNEKIFYESNMLQSKWLNKTQAQLLYQKNGQIRLIVDLHLFRKTFQCTNCSLIISNRHSYWRHKRYNCLASAKRQKRLKANQKVISMDDNGLPRLVISEYVAGRWSEQPTLIDRLEALLDKKPLYHIESEHIPVDDLPAELIGLLNLNTFLTYDLETTAVKSNLPIDTANYSFIGRHVPLIITVTRADTNETRIWEASSFSNTQIVESFVLYCLEVALEFTQKKRAYLAEFFYFITSKKQFTQNGFEMQKLVVLEKQLSQHINTTPIFGYNSARFDLPILLNSKLIEYLYLHDLSSDGKKKMPTAIKKGEKYIVLKSPHLNFLDAIVFEGGSPSLSDSLQQTFPNDTSLHKKFLPYKVLKKGIACFSYGIPEYESFFDEMAYTNTLDIEYNDYMKARHRYKMSKNEALEYLNLKKIPQVGREKHAKIVEAWKEKGFTCFRDILIDYCISDVKPLIRFLQTRILSYYIIAQQYLHGFVTISSFAFHITYNSMQENQAQLFYIPGEHLTNLIRANLLGGMTFICTKFVELGVTKIRPYDYENPNVAKAILGYDANSQYPSVMCQKQFTGPPIYRCAEDNFKADFIQRHKISPLQYVEYVNRTENCEYMHSLCNKGEVSVFLESIQEVYRLDGYGVRQQNGRIVPVAVEFFECNGSHGFCGKNCCLFKRQAKNDKHVWINGLSHRENKQNTQIRIKNLKKIYGRNFHFVWSCEWMHMTKTNPIAKMIVKHFSIGPAFVPNQEYTEREILDEILNDKIEGLVLASACVRLRSRKKFADYPPIAKRENISVSMLSPVQQAYAKKMGLHLSTTRSLNIPGFFSENVLFTTEEIKQLVFNYDTKIYNIKEIYQFSTNFVLKPIMEKLFNMRSEAKKNNQPALSISAKVLMNSVFGKTIQKVHSYKDTFFVDTDTSAGEQKIAKAFCSPHFVSDRHVSESIAEISMKKEKIIHKLPIIVGYFILAHSKRQTQNFAHQFLGKFIDPKDYIVLMSDTDSIYVALSQPTLDECVSPEKQQAFQIAKKELFTNRLFGWKLECEIKFHGGFAAPQEKVYGIYKKSSGGVYYQYKAATKGVNMRNVNNHELFEYDTLKKTVFGEIEPLNCQAVSFRNIKGGIVTTECTKQAMTGLSFKRYLLEDQINTVPLPNL